MNSRGRVALIVVFIVCSLGGFMVANAWPPGDADQTRVARSENDPLRALGGWLRLMPDQFAEMSKVDESFTAERDKMEAELAAERERLASMFENESADNDAIMAQVEKVIEIHDRLERRVAAYLLALRPHLTAGQRAKLFKRCGEEVRQAGGRRRGHGRGYGGPPPGRGPGAGNGLGSGRGAGSGHNRELGSQPHRGRGNGNGAGRGFGSHRGAGQGAGMHRGSADSGAGSGGQQHRGGH